MGVGAMESHIVALKSSQYDQSSSNGNKYVLDTVKTIISNYHLFPYVACQTGLSLSNRRK